MNGAIQRETKDGWKEMRVRTSNAAACIGVGGEREFARKEIGIDSRIVREIIHP